MIKTIKAPFFIALVCMGLLAACNSQPNVDLADNALDGGRYFIENCMQGDFKKAKNYLVESPQNEAIFDTLSAHYYLLDKEGRQQLRQASIQINEVSSIDATHSIIDYQNSFDKIPMKMSVIATPKGWKVDLQYSYPQKEK